MLGYFLFSGKGFMIQIDNILTLDPVSRFSNGAGNKPSNVSSWTNIRTTGDSYGFNDLIADLGGELEHINGFTNVNAEKCSIQFKGKVKKANTSHIDYIDNLFCSNACAGE